MEEDSILEDSKGATYMSFILDVEIVIKKEDARFNLAQSLIEGKQTKRNEEINKNEKEESKLKETQEERSEQYNKEQMKDGDTHVVEAMELNSFFGEFGLKRGKPILENSLSSTVGFMFEQLKSSKYENSEKQETVSTLNNSDRISEKQEKVKESVFVWDFANSLPVSNTNSLPECNANSLSVCNTNSLPVFNTNSKPVSNNIFMCNYLKTSSIGEQIKNINGVCNDNHHLDQNKTQDYLLLNAPCKEIVSFNSSKTLPAHKNCNLWKKNKPKFCSLPTTKPGIGIEFSSGECNTSEPKNKFSEGIHFSIKVNEGKKCNNNHEKYVVKTDNSIEKYKCKVPTFEIQQSFINKSDSEIKSSYKRHSYDNLNNDCNLVNNNLSKKYFSSPNLMLEEYNLARKKIYVPNKVCGRSFFKPHFVSIKEGREFKGILESDAEIKKNNEEKAPKTRSTNKKSRLQKYVVRNLVFKKRQPLRFPKECRKTQLMTSDNIKTLDIYSTNTENPLFLWGNHQSNIAQNVQSKYSYPAPLKYVWTFFRRSFGLRPAKKNM